MRKVFGAIFGIFAFVLGSFWKLLDWLGRSEVALHVHGWLSSAIGFVASRQELGYVIAPWMLMGLAIITVALLQWPSLRRQLAPHSPDRIPNAEAPAPHGKGPKGERRPLEIIFDPQNPGCRFWSLESPMDESGRRETSMPAMWEYRVAVKNNTLKTVNRVQVTVEAIGQMALRPERGIFEMERQRQTDLHPGEEKLVVIFRWSFPVRQAGMLAGPSRLEYGPLKITATAEDTQPSVRIFQVDYEREPIIYD